MMHLKILESSWSSTFSNFNSSNFDLQFDPYSFEVDDDAPNYLFNSSEDTSSEASSLPFLPSIMLTNDHFSNYPIEDTLYLPPLIDVNDLSMELDCFDDLITRDHQVVAIQGFQLANDGTDDAIITWSPTPNPSLNSNLSSNENPLTLPQQGMEIENQVSLPHMLEALGEAMYREQKSLVEVIMRCMRQKVSPIAEPLERLVFYLCQDMKPSQGDCCYLTQEATKNFEVAFRAFYQGLPHGKFAHFVANFAILEAMPHDCEVLHIVDFDMGEGSQWSPMIEAIANMHKTLKLTSIKWREESSECVSSPWKFEEIRRELYEHARSCGLKLIVEEKGMEELASELKRMNKRGGKREFFAFNCMVGLPHMGRGRSRRHVMQFLNLIKSCGKKGIVTFGDGRACEKIKNDLEFRSFFYGHLEHCKALLESIESHFPTHFSDARIAMECLFVAPYISSLAWLQKWEEIRGNSHLEAGIGLESCRLNNNAILMEVREILSGSDCSYQAIVEGQNHNELILEWKGTQLVRVSAWRN